MNCALFLIPQFYSIIIYFSLCMFTFLFLLLGGSGQRKKKGGRNRSLAHSAMFDSARARESPPLPRNPWRVEEGDVGFSCKTEGQTFLGLSNIAACIAMFLRTTGLYVSSVNLACVIRVESLNSLIISGRFVMRFAEGSFHGDEDRTNSKNCSCSPEAAGGPFLACPPHS